MTKPVELENLLDDFADELNEEDLEEIERYFERETIIGYLREAKR